MDIQHNSSYNTDDVTRFDECPVPDQYRKRTDIFCTICTGLFALILFIVCCATFNNTNLVKMTYYVDSDGNICGYDEPVRDYIYMYFTSMNDPSKRLCVSQCPKGTDKLLACYPTKGLACAANKNPDFQVQIYDTASQINRIGGICYPSDPTLKDQVYQMSKMESKYTFLQIYDSIWTCLWVSIVFGVVLIILMQCMTRKIVHWIFILGSLTFIALGITIFMLLYIYFRVPEGFILFKIIGGLIFIFMGVLIALSYLKPEYRQQIFVSSRLFQIAASIVKQRPWIILSIIIWSILQFGLITLTAFEILSAWSIGPLVFDQSSPFLKTNSFISNFLSFFIFVQFIWGLSFLKETFNFCVSGYATNWYCYRAQGQTHFNMLAPAKRLIKYHWGSVAGGSLLLCVFYFVDLFIDFFWSTDTAFQTEGKNMHSRPFKRQVVDKRGCRGLFDLIRSQAFGYINLIPIPYCNASRYCEMLADDSKFYDRSQTTNRLYRLSAHIVIIMMSTLISLAHNNHTYNHPNVVGVFFVALVSLFTVTYFISLHGDLAEGILISIFVEQRLSQFGKQVNINGQLDPGTITRPPQIVKDAYADDINDVYHNSTIMEYLRAHLVGTGKNQHAPADIF